jgi:hypothetical protein
MASDSPYRSEDYNQAHSVRVEITDPSGEVTREILRLTLDQWTEIWAAGIPQSDSRSHLTEAGAEKLIELATPFYTESPKYEGKQVRLYVHRGAE